MTDSPSTDKSRPHKIVDLSPGRRAWINTLRLPGPRNAMYGFLEVDVTAPRRLIAAHKERTGESLSFTGFLTYCLARAVDEDKSVQAYLKGRKHLVHFDDVDVGLMVERQLGGKKTLMGHVVRGANRKSVRAIHDEIRAVQAAPVPTHHGMPGWFRRGMLLPWPFSKLFGALVVAFMNRDPTIAVGMGGTVAITSIGMFGEGHSGWGLYPMNEVLGLVVGSIARKPAVVGDRVEPREILHLTLKFDHEIVDGGPAARFTHRLVELIESAAGVAEALPETRVKAGRDGHAPG